MAYLRWIFRIIVFVVVAAALHYTLPQRDIVRVVNTYEERQDFGGWTEVFWSGPSAGQPAAASRDVLFIQTVQGDGEPMVFRNEDTSWRWPPYFKFDTADLQTRAADAISNRDTPEWYAMRHYGWRNQWLSIFPNALSIKPVSGPEERLIPWFNIVFLTVGGLLWLSLWRLWRNFRSNRIDPLVDDLDARGDRARGRFSKWWSGR